MAPQTRTRAMVSAGEKPAQLAQDGVSSVREAAMVLLGLKHERARARQDASVPENTLRAYEFELHCFGRWCDRSSLQAIPADPRTIAVYLQELADKGRDLRDVPRPEMGLKEGPLSYGTIIRALGAICRAHTRRDMPSPWKLQSVKDARIAIGRQLGVAPMKKTALTVDLMCKLVDQIPTETLRGARDRGIILLGWHGARRRSEIAAARIEDFAPGPGGVVWTIPRSKTDQQGKGFEVPVARAEDRRYCAIAALGTWVERARIRRGPLFRRIDDADQIFDDAIAPDFVARLVKTYARAAGLDESLFSGHSLRSGWVTTAAQNGRTTHAIMRVTGHRDPKTVDGYIQHANVLEDAPGKGLV